MTPKRQYKDLSSVLKSVLEDYNLSENLAKNDLIENWQKIAGKDLSDKCTATNFVNGELTVKAKNKIWKEELALGSMIW